MRQHHLPQAPKEHFHSASIRSEMLVWDGRFLNLLNPDPAEI